MAMTNCKECGKEISSEAIHCPYCGIQVNDTKGMKTINGLAWLGVIIMFLWMLLQWL